MGRGRDAAQPPTLHRTAHWQRVVWPQWPSAKAEKLGLSCVSSTIQGWAQLTAGSPWLRINPEPSSSTSGWRRHFPPLHVSRPGPALTLAAMPGHLPQLKPMPVEEKSEEAGTGSLPGPCEEMRRGDHLAGKRQTTRGCYATQPAHTTTQPDPGWETLREHPAL